MATNKNIKPLKKVLDQLLKAYGIDKKVKSYSVIDDWQSIVGEKISKHSKAERIESGKLFVSVQSSVWRQELLFKKDEILKKINSRYKEEIVKDIIFR